MTSRTNDWGSGMTNYRGMESNSSAGFFFFLTNFLFFVFSAIHDGWMKCVPDVLEPLKGLASEVVIHIYCSKSINRTFRFEIFC